MAFLERKKDTDNESPAAPEPASVTVSQTPRPPVVVTEPVAIANADLTAGSHQYESVEFLRVAVQLPEPVGQPVETIEFLDQRMVYIDHLRDAIGAAVGEPFQYVRVEVFPAGPTIPRSGLRT